MMMIDTKKESIVAELNARSDSTKLIPELNNIIGEYAEHRFKREYKTVPVTRPIQALFVEIDGKAIPVEYQWAHTRHLVITMGPRAVEVIPFLPKNDGKRLLPSRMDILCVAVAYGSDCRGDYLWRPEVDVFRHYCNLLHYWSDRTHRSGENLVAQLVSSFHADLDELSRLGTHHSRACAVDIIKSG